MIIGDGLVATAMKRIDSDDVIIFASGVSNSREKKIGEFLREEKLLMNVLCDKLIIYLSSVHQENSPYGIHKRRMEEIIRTTKNYLILRVSQLLGYGGNPNTLVNFIKNRIVNGELIPVYRGVKRSIIDVDDVVNIVNYLSGQIGIFDLGHIEYIFVDDIVFMIGERLGIKPIIKYIEGVKDVQYFNHPLIDFVLDGLKIERKGYTKKIINKYF